MHFAYTLISLFFCFATTLHAQYGADMSLDTITHNDRIDQTRNVQAMAEDNCGNIHLTFIRRYYPPGQGFSRSVVVYAYKPYGQSWSFEKVLSDTNENVYYTGIRINPVTQAPHIVYQSGEGYYAELMEATVTDGQWINTRLTGNKFQDSEPSFVFDGDGTPHYTWVRQYADDSAEVVYAHGRNRFSNPLAITESRSTAPISPRIAVSGNRMIHITFRAWRTTSATYDIGYASKTDAGQGYTFEFLKIPGREHAFSCYITSRGNDVHLFIGSRNGLFGAFEVHYLKRDLNTMTWSVPERVGSYSADASEPFIDANGKLHVILNRIDDGGICATGNYCWQSGYIVYATNRSGSWKTLPVYYDQLTDRPFMAGDFYDASMLIDKHQNTYIVHYSSDNLSMSSHEIRVLTDAEQIAVQEPVEEIIPNVFSPNRDGLNDLFDYRLNAYSIFNLTIYNRWGTKVFGTDNLSVKWDGTVNGSNAAEGTYFYILTTNRFLENECGITLLDEEQTRKGTLTLIR
jgi:gliding motility-associated-like protein